MANSGYELKININTPNKIIKEHGLDKEGTATRFLRNTIDRFCDPYVPYGEGSGVHMKNKKTYPNNYSIRYALGYAHYHYVGNKAIGASRPKGVKRIISNKPMQYQGAPRRGPQWDKRMMNDRRKEVCKDLENFIQNGGN